jgi:hypothetical protein
MAKIGMIGPDDESTARQSARVTVIGRRRDGRAAG